MWGRWKQGVLDGPTVEGSATLEGGVDLGEARGTSLLCNTPRRLVNILYVLELVRKYPVDRKPFQTLQRRRRKFAS